MLAETLEAGKRAGAIKRQSFEKVMVDTTVQEKVVAHPTDSRLLNTAREKLVEAAQSEGIELRHRVMRGWARRNNCRLGVTPTPSNTSA